VAEGDDDADVVAEVESGAQDLRAKLVRLERAEIAAPEAAGDHEDGHEEAEEGECLIPGQAGLVDQLDGCVGEDPEGEAGDGEGDGLEMGEAGHSSLSCITAEC